MTRRSNLPRRAWATAAAVCAHLLALLALGWRIPKLAAPSPAEDRSPAFAVTLVRPEVRPKTPSPGRAAPAPPSSQRVLISPTPGAPTLSAPTPSVPEQTPPAPAPPEANAGDQRLRNTLRGLVGCADPAAYHLTREEREACDRQLAAAKPAPVSRQYSAGELAQFDAENKYDPVLARRPHNGCLPGAGAGPNAPPGTSSAAATTFGLRCSWSFW